MKRCRLDFFAEGERQALSDVRDVIPTGDSSLN